MARRRKNAPPPSALRRTLNSEFAKPLFGLLCIGTMWVAFKLGMVAWVGTALMAPLAPDEPTNAGEVYRQHMAKKAPEQDR